MVIVAAADDRMAMPLAVTLYSALANLAGVKALSLYIIDGGISEKHKRRLIEVLSVKHIDVYLKWIRPDLSALNGVKTNEDLIGAIKWHTNAAYLRLLIPEIMPEFDRAIYLDSDLVVEKNLHALWEKEIGDRPAVAVQDYMVPYVSSVPKSHQTDQMLKLPANTPYYNTGVMVINLKRWREENIGRKALEYIHKFQQFQFADQDALNAIIAGAWGPLDPKWNVMLSVITRYGRRLGLSRAEMHHAQRNLLKNPFILHFTGPTKPWHFVYRGPARSRFFYYLKKSGWFGPIEDMTSLMRETWERQNEYEPWLRQLYLTSRELGALIPPGDSFILVEKKKLGCEILARRRSIPFLERNGRYWGRPPDGVTAVRECERLRRSGANFIVFGWPAFWWLDYYHELNRHLRSSSRCVLHNDRVVVFDLRP